MTPADLIAHYGTQAAAANARGLDRQLIQGWVKRGSIPLDQQCEYEVASGGQLKADLPEGMRDTAQKPTKRKSGPAANP
jgi:hypothetical protein